MSANQLLLCSRIINETFGEVVVVVANCLAKHGALTLKNIVRHCSSLKPNQVRMSLSVLITHNMVTFGNATSDIASPVIYTLNIYAVLGRNRFPFYIVTAKQLFGSEAELIIEEILRHGQLPTNTILTVVADRLWAEATEDKKHLITINSVFKEFRNLVNGHFIRRCPSLVPTSLSEDSNSAATSSVPNFANLPDHSAYDIPTINFADLEKSRKRKLDDSEGNNDQQPPAKRALLNNGTAQSVSHVTTGSSGNPEVLWCVNVSRFCDHIRDKHIVSAISRRFGKTAGEIVKTILKGDENLNSKSSMQSSLMFNDIIKSLPEETEIRKNVAADQWLKILIDTATSFLESVAYKLSGCRISDEQIVTLTNIRPLNLLRPFQHLADLAIPQFIRRTCDQGGGTYTIDYETSYKELAIHHIESVLQERFGGKARRVFRVLLNKQRLEEKQVMEYTMMNDKGLLRRLLDEQFLSLTEVARGMDYNPHKTIYLFSVDLLQVIRIVLDKSYKGLSNLINRRITLKQEHEGLLTQEQRMQAIIAQYGYDESFRQEAEEMLSTEEKEQLAKFKSMTKKLEQAELQIDSTIFVLETYLSYSCGKPLPAKKSS